MAVFELANRFAGFGERMASVWPQLRSACAKRCCASGSNYLLNPRHPDFERIVLGSAEAVEIDTRLVRLGTSLPKSR